MCTFVHVHFTVFYFQHLSVVTLVKYMLSGTSCLSASGTVCKVCKLLKDTVKQFICKGFNSALLSKDGYE